MRRWRRYGELIEVFPEVVERAVRVLFEANAQYPSQWTAIGSIAGKIGVTCRLDTLRGWPKPASNPRWGPRAAATTGNSPVRP